MKDYYDRTQAKMMEMFAEALKKVEVTTYMASDLCLAVLADDICITVFLTGHINSVGVMPRYGAFIDTNNCPCIETALAETGLAKPYLVAGVIPVFERSGYCVYPLYQFDEEKLKALDPEGCQKYEAMYDAATERLQ